MDFVNKMTGSSGSSNEGQQNTQSGGGFMNKMNEGMGGGQAGERNEDLLDKGVDFVQERMGGGPQNNESAMEQAKDERISDGIRSGYKNITGSDIPIQDK
ncbi:hypothetical protein DL96DRAFT_1619525 [Flagelloscypha sp. PMI_526]|nr:hypothetical protein DL96DRAFT_1619525 [Flagelloscypha sp. PMI_526]